MSAELESLPRIVEESLAWARARNYEGVDPYDALNSPFATALSLGTRFGRIALTQLLRRSPINLRPLLGIRPGANPKALGLFLESLVKLDRHEECDALVRRLADLRSPASGSAWGYNFPWQNRFQLLPRWTPTIVNAAFIGNALLDHYDATGSQLALDLALSIPDFLLNDLNRECFDDDSFCFSYTPLDENYVHNANLLGAALLARLAVQYGVDRALDPALCALRYSAKRQRPDGSWFYAERKEQRWIDSFHTGFNLEAIRRFLKLGLAPELAEPYKRGVRFYAENFFLEDGAPKYYADRFYLVDVHAPAEAIYFFAGEGAEYRDLTDRVLRWFLTHMRDKASGAFYFRRKGRFAIKIPYMRWSQAWALRGLIEYSRANPRR
ncbi:MAG: hypothetical protein IJM30_13280 [Thermoguttaceae bacterium]|nr:hypothetical protein [Thermoguttaceae bacterium]